MYSVRKRGREQEDLSLRSDGAGAESSWVHGGTWGVWGSSCETAEADGGTAEATRGFDFHTPAIRALVDSPSPRSLSNPRSSMVEEAIWNTFIINLPFVFFSSPNSPPSVPSFSPSDPAICAEKVHSVAGPQANGLHLYSEGSGE